MTSLTEAAIAATAADAEWVRANPCGPTWTRPPHEQVHRLIAAEWERAEAAEVKLAEVRQCVGNFLAQYGDSQLPVFKVAIDLANSVRKTLERNEEEAVRD